MLSEIISNNRQQYYQDLLNTTKDAIFLSDLRGNLIEYNLALSQLLGISFEDIRNIDIHKYLFSLEKKEKFISRLLLVKRINNLQIKLTPKVGPVRICFLTAELISHTDFEGYTAKLNYISAAAQKEQRKKEKDLEQQSAKMKEQFLANVSHEMRTPLNAVLGMSHLILQTRIDEEQSNYINSIKYSSEILLGVVNDILQISEIQNKSICFENKSFDLFDLLYNLINVMQYKVKQKDLFLELVVAENLPQILRGDNLRLNQILYNLVGNAIKFTDNGYIKIYVSLLSRNQFSAQVKFLVEDTGIGIPPEKIEAIFESFTRVKTENRLFEGTGLGLSIAKSLVEQQGGKIGLESQIGKGSKFFFDLIFEIGDELEKFYQVNVIPSKIDIKTSFKLLLVEDNKINQLVAKKILEKHWENIDISIANNGKEAISIVEKENFNIILMDIQMPIMDGYEATKYIRQQMPSKKNQIPILVMTAHAHIAQNQKFKDYEWNDYILKPFQPEILFQKIEKHILF